MFLIPRHVGFLWALGWRVASFISSFDSASTCYIHGVNNSIYDVKEVIQLGFLLLGAEVARDGLEMMRVKQCSMFLVSWRPEL